MTLIWTEKYRPERFEDIVGQEEIVKRIKAFVEQKNMPHLLFAGPAGTGKTTLSLVIAKQLYGNTWRENFLELNASDDRGIDTVRNKVKDFARTKAIGDVPFKIIYLDESDALTREAQQALRRTMENFTKTARFVLSCNFSSKILEPIQSRCAVFRFKPLKNEQMEHVIERIVRAEELALDKDAHEVLLDIAQGDCRKLENVLQSCAVLGKKITKQDILEIAAFAEPKEIKDALALALQNRFADAREKLLQAMLHYGASGLDVIKQVQKEIWGLALADEKKMQLVDKCGEIEFRMVEGADEFVQLEAFLAVVAQVGNNPQEKVR